MTIVGEEEVERQRQVSKELSKLSDTIEHLSEIIEDLEKKLGGVLVDEVPDKADEKTEVLPSIVTLANDIRNFRCTIESIARRVSSILKRLEL